MGRSIRTDQWRYTDWNEGAQGEELYDKVQDPKEFVNLAKDSNYSQVKAQLKQVLDEKVSGQVPRTAFNPARL